MDFLEKVKKIASDVAVTSGKQGKKLYSTARLNLEISDKQKKVKNLYKEIGYEAYKAFKGDGKLTEIIRPMLEEIDAYEEEIALLRKRIDEIKNTEEIGVDDTPSGEEEIVDVDVYDGPSQYDSAETEPIDGE